MKTKSKNKWIGWIIAIGVGIATLAIVLVFTLNKKPNDNGVQDNKPRPVQKQEDMKQGIINKLTKDINAELKNKPSVSSAGILKRLLNPQLKVVAIDDLLTNSGTKLAITDVTSFDIAAGTKLSKIVSKHKDIKLEFAASHDKGEKAVLVAIEIFHKDDKNAIKQIEHKIKGLKTRQQINDDEQKRIQAQEKSNIDELKKDIEAELKNKKLVSSTGITSQPGAVPTKKIASDDLLTNSGSPLAIKDVVSFDRVAGTQLSKIILKKDMSLKFAASYAQNQKDVEVSIKVLHKSIEKEEIKHLIKGFKSYQQILGDEQTRINTLTATTAAGKTINLYPPFSIKDAPFTKNIAESYDIDFSAFNNAQFVYTYSTNGVGYNRKISIKATLKTKLNITSSVVPQEIVIQWKRFASSWSKRFVYLFRRPTFRSFKVFDKLDKDLKEVKSGGVRDKDIFKKITKANTGTFLPSIQGVKLYIVWVSRVDTARKKVTYSFFVKSSNGHITKGATFTIQYK